MDLFSLWGELSTYVSTPVGVGAAGSLIAIWIKGRMDIATSDRKIAADIKIAEGTSAIETRRLLIEQQDNAFDHLKELVDALREDIKVLRAALAAETTQRLAAEREVRDLRLDISRLQGALAAAAVAAGAVKVAPFLLIKPGDGFVEQD